MPGYLRVETGPDKGRVFHLIEGTTLVLGRGQKSDTQLKDFAVSRIHCEVSANDGKLTIIDHEGSSGTFLNGKKIALERLKKGDTIRIGDTELAVQFTDPQDAETVSPGPKPPRTLQEAATGLTGQFINHFEVGPIVAKGSTGTIYKAKDVRDGKNVALKVLHQDFVDEEEDVQRFVRAMQTAIDLKHPHLIALHNAGKFGGLCWLAMEYFEGESVLSYVKRTGVAGMLDWTYALHVAHQISGALEAAHAQDIVHRGISPSNILVNKGLPPTAKLGDLMLAKALQGIKAKAITKPGELVGDITYMSPERTTEDGQDDKRGDIYALGATLYLLMTGHPPFEGPTIVATLVKIRKDAPVPPKKYQLCIPDGFQDLVLWMMAKRKEDRPQSIGIVTKELEKIAKFASVKLS